jgi:hypothetical protein
MAVVPAYARNIEIGIRWADVTRWMVVKYDVAEREHLEKGGDGRIGSACAYADLLDEAMGIDGTREEHLAPGGFLDLSPHALSRGRSDSQGSFLAYRFSQSPIPNLQSPITRCVC